MVESGKCMQTSDLGARSNMWYVISSDVVSAN